MIYTDPTGHFIKIKFNKFFKRLGDPLTTTIGILTAAVCPLCGAAILTQSQSGRYVIAGSVIVGSAAATWYCGGCGVGVGALIGSVGGGAVGGYSAAKNGGDLSSGLAFGAVVGAVAGGTAGYLGPLAGDPTQIGSLLSAKGAKFIGYHAFAGAVVGTGSGATVGYAGGAGSWDNVLTSTLRGTVIGAVLGGALAGAEYALSGSSMPASWSDLSQKLAGWPHSTITMAKAFEYGWMPMIEVTALSVSIDTLLTSRDAREATLNQLQKQVEKGFACTLGDGSHCKQGYD